MKVLVTGGAGFIGRHSVRGLLASGAQVLVVDDFSASRPEALDEFRDRPGFSVVTGDVCDPVQVAEAMAPFRPDAVIHLAGLVSIMRSLEDPRESWRRNVQATRTVADAAAAAGCRRLVFASSAAVYADSVELPLHEGLRLPPALSPYGANKAEAEQLLLAMPGPRMHCIVLRYFNVYGPGQPPDSPYSGVITRFLDRVANGQALQVFGDGGQSRDFVHVRDVARVNAHAAMFGMPPGIYNICNGIGISINALVSLLQQRFPALRAEHFPAREGEIRHSLGSAERLSSVLATWQPIPFADGLAGLCDGLASQ